MKPQLNAFFTTLDRISNWHYWPYLNQLGIFQTTAHRLTCRVSSSDTRVIRQPLPVELVDLSIVSKQAVYLFFNVRYLRVNVSRKALILQRFHLYKQLFNSSSPILDRGKITVPIRVVKRRMTWHHLRQTAKLRNYCCSIPSLLSMPTCTKRSEIIVNAQEIAASLVVPAACCINWSCCIQGANSLSSSPCIKLSPTLVKERPTSNRRMSIQELDKFLSTPCDSHLHLRIKLRDDLVLCRQIDPR